ncbi:hypothetical protein [Demequina sp.]|uniref:hypothetical protein n=1 Tax=Demequina sp. TaxID=2050685 RepID=UPI003A8BAD9D
MNDLAKKYGASALPAVNLIPREIAEKRKMKAAQFTALMAVLIALGAVVVLYVVALGAKGLADNQLADSREAQDLAVEARDSKSDIYGAYRAQEFEEYALAQIGFGQVDYTQLSTAVLATSNGDTSFDALQFGLPTAFGYPTLNEDPVSGGGVGTMTFTARATSNQEVTDLLTRIEQIPGIARVDAVVEQFATDPDGDVYWQAEGTAIVTGLRIDPRLMPVGGVSGLDMAAFVATQGDSASEAQPEPTTSSTATSEGSDS